MAGPDPFQELVASLSHHGWDVEPIASIPDLDYVVDAVLNRKDVRDGRPLYLEILDYSKDSTAEILDAWRSVSRTSGEPLLVLWSIPLTADMTSAALNWTLIDEHIETAFDAPPGELAKKLKSIYSDADTATSLSDADEDTNAHAAFTRILTNRDKTRDRPFVVFVRGGPDATVLERACSDQTWAKCFTYRCQIRGRPKPDALLALFEEYLREIPATDEQESQEGRFLPDVSSHLELHGPRPSAPSGPDSPSSRMSVAIRMLEPRLRTGMRLVLFGEFSDLDDATSLDDLGFTDELLQLLGDANERIGIVISGVPESIVSLGADGPSLVEHPSGYAPALYALQLEHSPLEHIDVHGQALSNDVPGGPDQLRIESEVDAIAETIALEKMEPPLVVGVIGGWGGGKSFVLHLIEERLRDIRAEPVVASEDEGDGENTDNYVGHLYVIRFDAWTYAKSSLWASLMQTILLEFNRQLGIEQTLRELSPQDEPRVWRMLTELGYRRVQTMKKEKLLDRAIASAIGQIDEKEIDKDRLWDRFIRLRKAEQAKLDEAELALANAQSRLAAARAVLEEDIDDRLDAKSRRYAWQLLGEEAARRFGKDISKRFENHEVDVESFGKLRKLVGLKHQLGLGLNKQTLMFGAFAAISILVAWFLNWHGVEAAIAGSAGMVAALSGALQVLMTGRAWIEERYDEYQQRSDEMRGRLEEQRDAVRSSLLAEQESNYRSWLEKQKEPGRVEAAVPSNPSPNQPAAEAAAVPEETGSKDPSEPVTMLEQRVRGLEARAGELRQSVGFTADYESLIDFVKGRIDSGYYDEQLGLLHQVQKDLQDLTDALLDEEDREYDLFPRGKPRIVLLIDDLDRCPPERVVEVLEAAQLLVKTRLFVIVLAIDVRYITRALEKQYRQVLIRHGEPSGLDYIEKIIQVPYRVRPIQSSAMEGFLSSQMDIRKAEEERRTVEDTGRTDIGAPTDTEAAEPSTDSTQRAVPNAATAPTAKAHARKEKRPVPRAIVKFEDDEPGLLAECCNAVIISPRAAKRLVNVFKLLKIIWNRRNLGDGPATDVKRVMLMLLAVSSRHPQVMQVLLHKLDDEYRKKLPANKLVFKFLDQTCLKETRTAINPNDWVRARRLLQNEKVLPRNVTFTELGEENFRLVLSFSFVGETDPENEIAFRHRSGQSL